MTDGDAFREDLEGRERRDLAPYALRSAERHELLGEAFREYPDDTKLEFRTEYHRDRDRILWSAAFRRLQHKTQIFPHYVEDHYRRRLTHSLEVAQIATTLARALRLNEVAAEAIALAHDLGHTAFGHGGEEALNLCLLRLAKPSDWTEKRTDATAPVDMPPPVRHRILSTPVLVYGFDHCVQGVEQVSRVSHDYASQYPGLNLTFDVRDGILKHIYDKDAEKAESERQPFSSLANIVRLKKFEEFKANCGSLEAQCVWFADKVGYLLGDMEDGLRARIFTFNRIAESGLVRALEAEYKRVRNATESPEISSHDEFLSFRRRALAVLILDSVSASSSQIADVAPRSVEDVLSSGKRLVDVGEALRKEWNAFYDEFSEKILFHHEDVKTCEFKARTIIDGLFAAYMQDADLLPREFRERTEEVYKDLLEPQERNIMAVRNYIAGMTDSFATEQHKRLYMSSERAGIL